MARHRNKRNTQKATKHTHTKKKLNKKEKPAFVLNLAVGLNPPCPKDASDMILIVFLCYTVAGVSPAKTLCLNLFRKN